MKDQKNRTLGLDISTSITGVTVLEGAEILETTFWDTRNKKRFPTLYSKAAFIKERLWEIHNQQHISSIF